MIQINVAEVLVFILSYTLSTYLKMLFYVSSLHSSISLPCLLCTSKPPHAQYLAMNFQLWLAGEECSTLSVQPTLHVFNAYT